MIAHGLHARSFTLRALVRAYSTVQPSHLQHAFQLWSSSVVLYSCSPAPPAAYATSVCLG